MKVLKFGGSSLGNANCIRKAGEIILGESRKSSSLVVVVSAVEGVTNQLLECARLAERGDRQCELLLKKIANRHLLIVEDLLGKRRANLLLSQLNTLLGDLHDALHGIQLLGHGPPRALDLVASFGERMSALIIAAYLSRFRPAKFADARQFVVTDNHFTSANVLFSQTNRAIRKYFRQFFRSKPRPSIAVVTGFIGATQGGETTTIGRNGSDYTAAIVGAALDVSVIEIWTDVDGVLSADPKEVRNAFVLPRITYEEAMELSYFGAKVLHSAAIAPAVARRIPILIKNTFHPGAPGTLISRSSGDPERLATGITSIAGVTLLTLRGLAMVGIPGISERLFGALASRRINVILISQASSEHTICFAVREIDAPAAVAAVREEFNLELQHHLTSLDQKSNQAIVAVVGDQMKGHAGVSGKMFGALGRHNINISAIAQGASERNISCVVDGAVQTRTLNVIHQSFFERRKRLALVVIGVGNIGRTLLSQLQTQRAYLLARGFDVSVIGLSNSRHLLLDPNGIDLSVWPKRLAGSRRRMDPRILAGELAKLSLTDAAIVDCTAADSIVNAYSDFVRANLHIITPNKRANVLPWSKYVSLMDLLRAQQKHFLDEANVGAGLPVMSTLRDLIASGDLIRRIEGIFSGTLGYLFSNFDGTKPFSALVREGVREGSYRTRSTRRSVGERRRAQAPHSGPAERIANGNRRYQGREPRSRSASARIFFAQIFYLVGEIRRSDDDTTWTCSIAKFRP